MFSRTAPCRVVLAIQNANPYVNVRTRNWGHRLRYLAIKCLASLSARKSKFTLFMSYSSAELIGPQLGADPARFRVVYCGVDERFRETDRDAANGEAGFPLRAPYILCVSNLLAHKNIETLIHGYSEAVSLYTIAPPLVIAGAIQDRSYFTRLLGIVRERNVSGRTYFLGGVPHEQMPSLYKRAGILVHPSQVETFGMPLVEAMAAGVPVIAVDTPISREVCQSAALYFPQCDAHQLAARMKTVLSCTSTAATMRRVGLERSAAFSWRTTAKATLATLEEASACRALKN